MSRPRAQSVPRPAGPARAGRPDQWRAADRGPARGPEAFRPRTPREPVRRPARPEPRAGHGAGGNGARNGAAGIRLTGRGAILCLFLVSFLGMMVSGWLGIGALADVVFVAGCGAMAWYAKPSDLLTVAVSPPLAFFFACVVAKLASSAGGTSAAEGILVTLATSAPWLFAGTALTIVIALRRGLLGNIRELRQGLRGDAGGRAAGAGGRARRPR
jgi:hypothetical protein